MAEQKPHWTELLITVWELKGIWIFYHSICYFSKSWNRFDQHLNKSLLPRDPWMDLLSPLSSHPSQSCFLSCQEIYRTAAAGISHQGSQWLLPSIYHQHPNEERQNCRGRETSLAATLWEGSKLSSPQPPKQPRKRPAQGELKAIMVGDETISEQQGTQPRPRPGEAKEQHREHMQVRAHFFLDVFSAFLPHNSHFLSTEYRRTLQQANTQEDTTTGQHCHLLFVPHTLTLFLSLFWHLEIYSTWRCIFQSPRLTWFNH